MTFEEYDKMFENPVLVDKDEYEGILINLSHIDKETLLEALYFIMSDELGIVRKKTLGHKSILYYLNKDVKNEIPCN